jgi:hypothetical protein
MVAINMNIKDKMKTIATIIHTFLKMKYPNIPNRKEAAGRKIRMIYAGLNSGLIQTHVYCNRCRADIFHLGGYDDGELFCLRFNH